MVGRAHYPNARTTTVLGSTLVLLGVALFTFIFFTLYPVLRNPVGTYDRWFPAEEVEFDEEVEPDLTPPQAAFSWQTSVSNADPGEVTVQFADESVPSGESISSWTWDLGDNSLATGQAIEHEYAAAGNYLVRLTIEDAAGSIDSAQGHVAVRSGSAMLGDVGRITEFLNPAFGGDINSAVGSLGDAIGDPIGDVVDSVGATARGGVVVLLFGLAALGTTMVAWRVSRIGVMVLMGAPTDRGRWWRRPDDSDELRLVETNH